MTIFNHTRTLLVVMAFGCSIASAGFINGGLVPGVPNNDPGYVWVAGDSTSLTGWTVEDVDLVTNYWQAPPGAIYSVDLNGNGSGMIYQVFATMPGQVYRIDFFYAGNPDQTGSPVRTAAVEATGNPSQPIIAGFEGTREEMNWQPAVYTFTATGVATRLTFRGIESYDTGVVIGNVRLSEVETTTPEPATIGIMGAALALIAARKRRA